MAKKPKSTKYTMTNEDWRKWVNNILIFSAPSILVFLTALAAGRSFQDSSLVLYMALLNACIDFLKKFIQNSK